MVPQSRGKLLKNKTDYTFKHLKHLPKEALLKWLEKRLE